MSVVTTAKALINSKFLSDSVTSEYSPLSKTRVKIDNLTFLNTNGSSINVTLYIVPNEETRGDQHLVLKDYPVAAASGTTQLHKIDELTNHVLEPGDSVDIVAATADKVVVRMSGREILES